MLSYTSAVTIALDATPLIVTGGVQRYTLELASALAAEFPDDQYWLLSDQMIPKPLVLTGNLHYGDRPSTWAGRENGGPGDWSGKCRAGAWNCSTAQTSQCLI